MKIVYMGTPDFAVGPMEALLAAGHEILVAVTQPDKPKGRSGKLQATPVKLFAKEHGIAVMTPVKIKAAEAIEQLRAYRADVYIVAAFGQILSREILEIPPYGCLNIHASLLPAYRGAAPIQWAILNGETETGVTIMQMDAGIDTGDILLQEKVAVDEKETGDSLHEKLARVGSRLIVEALKKLEAGELTGRKQQEEESCYAKQLTKAMGHMDWTQSALVLERQVRGLNAWPGAFTLWRGKNLKIWEAAVCPETEDGPAGSVSRALGEEIVVNTGAGKLRLLTVQPEGKKKMATCDFLRGYSMEKGEVLQ